MGLIVFAWPLPVFGCLAPKLNKARLVQVQLQPERLQTVFPCPERPSASGRFSNPAEDMIGVSDHDLGMEVDV
jgi:hypothetical protein